MLKSWYDKLVNKFVEKKVAKKVEVLINNSEVLADHAKSHCTTFCAMLTTISHSAVDMMVDTIADNKEDVIALVNNNKKEVKVIVEAVDSIIKSLDTDENKVILKNILKKAELHFDAYCDECEDAGDKAEVEVYNTNTKYCSILNERLSEIS